MSYYDSCYAMQDGNLILRGIANHTQKNDTAPYLTGGVYTKGKKLFTGGRVEVCARLQAAKGGMAGYMDASRKSGVAQRRRD